MSYTHWISARLDTGNSPITVTGQINSSATNARDYGWNATLVYNGKAAGKITIPYAKSLTVEIVLSPTTRAFAPGATISANFNATINGSTVNEPISFTMQYPYASITPSPSGNGIIANYSGDALSTLITGIIIIAVTVAGGLFIASYRGRRFRR